MAKGGKPSYIDFINVFNRLANGEQWNPYAYRIYGYLLGLENNRRWSFGFFPVSVRDVERDTKITNKTAKKAFDFLKSRGLIETKTGGRGINECRIIPTVVKENSYSTVGGNAGDLLQSNGFPPNSLNKDKDDEDSNEVADLYDEDFKKVVNAYEKAGLGLINGFVREDIKVWSNVFPPDMLIEAIRITATSGGGKGWKYAEAILNNWQKSGFKSLQDVERHEQERKRPSRAAANSWDNIRQ